MTRIEIWVVDHLGWLFAAFSVLFVFALVLAVRHDNAIDQADINACMADGHKSYECRALVNGGKKQMVPMPIVVVSP